MEVKFGILSLPSIPHFRDSGFRYDLDSGSTLVIERVSETMKEHDAHYWREWVGTLAWEELSKHHTQIQVYKTSPTLDICDQENKDIEKALALYSKAILLSEFLIGPRGQSYIFTGKGLLRDGRLIPKHIQTFSKGLKFIAPDYMFLSEYQESDTFLERYKSPPTYGTPWFQKFRKIFECINIATSDLDRYFLLNISLYTFQQSLNEQYIDFSFPSLVRSIETLVTLGPGQGRGLFAKRLIRMLPSCEKLMFKIGDSEIKKIFKNT